MREKFTNIFKEFIKIKRKNEKELRPLKNSTKIQTFNYSYNEIKK